LVFAKESLALDIPLVVILTLPAEELRNNFSGDAALEFDQVLQKAAKVEKLLLSAQQPDAVTHLGQKLVDDADVLLAVSEGAGEDAEKDEEIIAYAVHRGRTVICLWETAKGMETRTIRSDETLPQSKLSVDQLQMMLGEPPPPPVIPERLTHYFNACDVRATRTAPRVRRYALNIVLANAIASMAGGFGSSFTHTEVLGTILSLIRFGCILLGLFIFAVLHRRQSQSQWLKLRLRAEICRSAMATWNSPFPVEPLSADEIPELHSLMQALRYFRATHVPPAVSLEAFKAGYGNRRLVDQYHYFKRQAEMANRHSSRLTPLYWILSGSALVLSALGLVIQLILGPNHGMPRWADSIFIFVPTMAPALASWIVAWQALEAVSRKRARFVEMERLMHQALIDLIHCHSWEAVHHVVERTEKQLLGEVLEWYSFVKYSS
jgi:hypothetical protein